MTDDNENKQDLGIAKRALPDQNWARTQPMFIAPSKDRLGRDHQRVSIKNTSDDTVTATGRPQPQKHIVIDRFNQGHELEPGETKHDIDMLSDDIEYFIRERMPNRVNHLNQMKPIHPIQVIGYDETALRSSDRDDADPEPAHGADHSREHDDRQPRRERVPRARTHRE